MIKKTCLAFFSGLICTYDTKNKNDPFFIFRSVNAGVRQRSYGSGRIGGLS